MPGISKEDRELADAARAKAKSVGALARRFEVSLQTASGWGRRYPIPRARRKELRQYVAGESDRAVADSAVPATDDGARHPLKDEPDLLQHLERQAELLALIPQLRREVALLRGQVALLEEQAATRRRANRGSRA